jgi:hypothetical protein
VSDRIDWSSEPSAHAGYLSWRGVSASERVAYDELLARLGSHDALTRRIAAHALDRALDDHRSGAVLYVWPAMYAAWLAHERSPVVERTLVSLGLRPDHHVLTVENADELVRLLADAPNDALAVAMLGVACRSFRADRGAALIDALQALASAPRHPKVRACAVLALAEWVRHGPLYEGLHARASDGLRRVAADSEAPWLARVAAALRMAWSREPVDNAVLDVLVEGALLGDDLSIAWNETPGGGWAFARFEGDPVAPLDAHEWAAMLRAALIAAGGAELLDRVVPQLLAAAAGGDLSRFDLAIDLLMHEEPLPREGGSADLSPAQIVALEAVANLPDAFWSAHVADAADTLAHYRLPPDAAALRRFLAAPSDARRRPAFEGLDTTDWAALSHAYGSAHDVPALIRGLASTDDDRRVGALDAMYSALVHQGSVYPASLAAIPHLVEILQHDGVRHRESVLDLLAHMAVGLPDDRVVPGFDPSACEELEARCHAAIDASASTVLELLEDDDVRVRTSAAFLLAWCPGDRSETIPALGERAAAGEHPAVQASAILALSQVDPVGEWLTRTPVAEVSVAPVPLPVAAGTLSWLRAAAVAGASAPTVDADRIVGVIARGVAPLHPDPWAEDADLVSTGFPWGDLASHLSAACRRLPAEPWLSRFATALSGTTDEAASLRLATALLDLTFGEPPPGLTTRPLPPATESIAGASAWSEVQRRALAAIVAAEVLWRGAVEGRAAPRGRARPVQSRLHGRLRLDFDPSREALRRALEA